MPSPAGSERRLRTPAITSRDDLAARLAYAREHAATVDRTAALEIVFMPDGLDMFSNAGVDTTRVVDSVAELAQVGVTYLTVSLPGRTRAAFLEHLDAFAGGVLSTVQDW